MQIANAKHPFQRVEVTRNEALEMFRENDFKVEIIQALDENARITLYKSGEMVDLCRGPHLPNTGYLKTWMVGNLNRAFWRGDTKNAPLQVEFWLEIRLHLLKQKASVAGGTHCLIIPVKFFLLLFSLCQFFQ